ncbi:MAG TPA: endonuclease III [Thermoleophilaceae bacterium]|nr:endonuclease III [Thermoleophilaceae bacterium]
MASRSDWKPPPPRRLRAILDRLRAEYGRPSTRIHGAPIDELLLTVLSQNTNDRNRDVAYERLRDRFPSWEAVRDAPVEEIEEAIRPGGLAVTKAPRIQRILAAISDSEPAEASSVNGAADGDGSTVADSGSMDLSWLADAPLDQARDYLCELPGVGRKTAACVLLFAYGRHDVPVDTHVHRVGTRLGLFRPGASLDECHDEMLRLSAGSDPLEAHVALIRHGRRICVARKPRCGECPLLRICPYGRASRL